MGRVCRRTMASVVMDVILVTIIMTKAQEVWGKGGVFLKAGVRTRQELQPASRTAKPGIPAPGRALSVPDIVYMSVITLLSLLGKPPGDLPPPPQGPRPLLTQNLCWASAPSSPWNSPKVEDTHRGRQRGLGRWTALHCATLVGLLRNLCFLVKTVADKTDRLRRAVISFPKTSGVHVWLKV